VRTRSSTGEPMVPPRAPSFRPGYQPFRNLRHMARDEASADPVVRQLREQISDNDVAIIEGINKRLRLVGRLKEYKTSRGFEFVDLAREDWMVSYLARANRGPLSAEGLREIFEEILDLTKREVGKAEASHRGST
jgi:chorismate mutase